MVGTLGRYGSRLALVAASAIALPARMEGRLVGEVVNM